ncbi:hypothetical protein [Flavobacterium sp. KACC 22761]|uniref:hypothetical protein n=1 Tax=Flavobacterium sp. KACC 22761 TaxID=3092665 RepID=UPI002A74F462|nr:hypothetical protein [Flavobacterium sp. KACC 22761]WPO80560.1 hypothetical protein SCB73_09255 [Flavobacterium sp. KACC 22761]
MRKFVWSILLVITGISCSFSQVKGIEKGTYLSTNKGQKIKLNLLEDNKYELVFYTGNYEIKGDSLIFIQKENAENGFDLAFATDKKAKKVKIKFPDSSYYSFYIGTQKGNEEVVYQRVSDIKTKIDPNWEKTDLEFDIEKTDYLYLVYENYDGKSNVCKYTLPKDVSEITVKYEFALLGDLKIGGFFDRKTNELKISEPSGKDPLVFLNEKNPQPEKPKKVIPLENQTISNWTYPGKENYNDIYGTGVAVDTTLYPPLSTGTEIAPPTLPSQYDFKLKIENNLKNALAATKEAKLKFLMFYSNSKDKAVKENFNAFVKDQETQAGYNMYDGYNPVYDVYNYYLAGADDKKWLKTNKITDDPSVLVLNSDGDILAKAKSDLSDKSYQFSYYGDLYKKLQRVNAFVYINKVFKNKKAPDADLISAFNSASVLEISYDYDLDETIADPNSTDFVITKIASDKKEVAQTWKKLIEAHQKDTKPEMYLVETIVREIKNQGFTKQLFNEDKVFSDTDFLAIDYLLKHSDKIEENRSDFNNKEDEVHNIGNVIFEISSALQSNSYIAQDKFSSDINKEKNISIYKKIIALGKGNFESYSNYFQYLNNSEDPTASNVDFLKEFTAYFDSNLTASSPIEKLDAMFSALDSSYDGWNSFKDYHSNLCNNAAWSVVLQSQNANFLKEAIKWSEYSLVITKNNPYYLDTLAQLYYKDGQKQKAIETQALAVKFLNAVTEPETAADIKETLDKMKNGTY